MLENLKTTSYNDGIPITEWVFGLDWGNLPNQQGLYQWVNSSNLNNIVDFEIPFDYYYYLTAIILISTLTNFGKLATSTVSLAGAVASSK
jgi:hypothetical protein